MKIKIMKVNTSLIQKLMWHNVLIISISSVLAEYILSALYFYNYVLCTMYYINNS